MPELPEVETVARAIRGRVTGATVREAQAVEHPHWVDARAVSGARILDVRRVGKHLLLDLDDAWTLDVHFGMSGGLRLHDAPSSRVEPELHERMRLALQRGREHTLLQLVDPRGFGHARLGERDEGGAVDLPALRRMGPDAVGDWPLTHFRAAIASRTTSIKAVLLDQSVVAGIGNYVADEALFAARVHPATPASALSAIAVRRLHDAVRTVLERSIALQGASLRDYARPDGERGGMQELLAAYGRAGEPCLRCGRPMVKTVVAGRGTTYCPRCQRLRG